MIHRKLKRKIKEESSLQKKASLTVESAFVLPFFFIAIVLIAGMIDLYRISFLIQTTLCEGAKELGMYAYCLSEEENSPVGIVNDGICMAYGSKKIRDSLKNENLVGIKGGINGILLFGSNYREDMVSLQASFFYQIPFSLFGNFAVPIKIKGQARAWNGFNGKLYGNIEDDEMVYITDWESVYHTSEKCTHLQILPEKISLEQAQSDRNLYGSKYHACESCIKNGVGQDKVYITQNGEAYHNDINCGGIRRTVRMVKKSETKALHACKRCGEGKK